MSTTTSQTDPARAETISRDDLAQLWQWQREYELTRRARRQSRKGLKLPDSSGLTVIVHCAGHKDPMICPVVKARVAMKHSYYSTFAGVTSTRSAHVIPRSLAVYVQGRTVNFPMSGEAQLGDSYYEAKTPMTVDETGCVPGRHREVLMTLRIIGVGPTKPSYQTDSQIIYDLSDEELGAITRRLLDAPFAARIAAEAQREDAASRGSR